MTNAASTPEVGLADYPPQREDVAASRCRRYGLGDGTKLSLSYRPSLEERGSQGRSPLGEADDEVELGWLNEEQTAGVSLEKYADIDSGSELRAANGRRTIRPGHAGGEGGHAMTLRRSRMFIAALAFVVPIAAQAQDSQQRKELRRVDLSGAGGMEVISSISEFRPGDELPRHLHHGIEAGYVVQGAMVQNPGQPPTMLATGAPILNLRDVVHGGFKVVGPGNLILFTVHTVDKGKPLYDWVK
jgi:quercetin dioxygenase-like cupin family protein